MKFKEVEQIPKKKRTSKYDEMLIAFDKSKIQIADITSKVPQNRINETSTDLKYRIKELGLNLTTTTREGKVYLKKA